MKKQLHFSRRRESSCYSTLILVFLLIASLQYCFPLRVAWASPHLEHPISAQVEEASDRAYEEKVYRLLREAEHSIVISMYLVRADTPRAQPVIRFFEALIEARRRGVTVEITLNSKFKNIKKKVDAGPYFDTLRKARAKIHVTRPHRMLHDKLLVIDEKIVVEGSMNWSYQALRTNWESTTIIHSPELARLKLLRIRARYDEMERPLGPAETTRIVEKEEPDRPYPDKILIPALLLLDHGYFPKMLTKTDARAMDLYLLLLGERAKLGEPVFRINLEKLGEKLGMPAVWDRSTNRRQVIKALRKLEKRYALLKIDFHHGKKSEITLTSLAPLKQDFTIPHSFFQSPLWILPQHAKFAYLVRSLLEMEEGPAPPSLSNQAALARRFKIDEKTLRRGFRELEGL